MIKKNFSIPEKMEEQLKSEASRHGLSQAEIVRGALRQELE